MTTSFSVGLGVGPGPTSRTRELEAGAHTALFSNPIFEVKGIGDWNGSDLSIYFCCEENEQRCSTGCFYNKQSARLFDLETARIILRL
jgi:hypothetical protein